jgi:hypothetical protein
VCEPQSVNTDVRYFGRYGLRTSKTRRPSQFVAWPYSGLVVGTDTLPSHLALLRTESVEVTRIPSLTVTSFCEPGQWIDDASAGWSGSRTSQICTPS